MMLDIMERIFHRKKLKFYEGFANWAKEEFSKNEEKIKSLEYECREGLAKMTVKQINYILQFSENVLLDLITKEDSNIVIVFESGGYMANQEVFDFHLYQIKAGDGKIADGYLHASITNNILHIHEIAVEPGNGWGTLLMKYVIEYARMKECIKITAWLAPVDLNDKNDPSHCERLLHFYNKHGFVVKNRINGEGKSACKELAYENLLFDSYKPLDQNQLLDYKGYRGTVFYSASESCFRAKLLGIKDYDADINGTDVASLQRSFCDAVDKYIDLNKTAKTKLQ